MKSTEEISSKRKAIAVCNQGVVEKLYDVIAELGWDCYDNVAVEIGGTSVYEIDGAGTKWAPVKGTTKYNKDAFIVSRMYHVVLLYHHNHNNGKIIHSRTSSCNH